MEEFYLTDPDVFVPFNHTYPTVPATYDVEVVATNDRSAKFIRRFFPKWF